MGEFEKILSECREHLAERTGYPLVDMDRLAQLLGVKLKRTWAGRQSYPKLVTDGESVEILLTRPSRPAEWTTRERFSIAHELGHCIIWRTCGYLPQGKADYWMHEALCNDFAAKLLVPASAVERLVKPLESKATKWLKAVDVLSAEAIVSWEAAAHRLTQETRRAYYITARLAYNAQHLPVWEIKGSTLSRPPRRQVGISCHIASESVEGRWIEGLLDSPAESKCPRFSFGSVRFIDPTMAGCKRSGLVRICILDPAAIEFAQPLAARTEEPRGRAQTVRSY